MSAEFLGQELEVVKAVKPLVALSDACFLDCLELEDVHRQACQEAVFGSGEVYVVHCSGFRPDDCQAMTTQVGQVDGRGEFTISPSFGLDVATSLRIAANNSQTPNDALESMQRINGLGPLSTAIAEHGFRDYTS